MLVSYVVYMKSSNTDVGLTLHTIHLHFTMPLPSPVPNLPVSFLPGDADTSPRSFDCFENNLSSA
jgi:hypothetical protein